ncbi:DUF817 family protein [Shimia abyssi]|uniref:Uncharacterized protein DUF817 n=1 Tax=Shimia abyssi TaxID=1662395 RepID=A0A2P8FK99_9RHOB|nr:DUF817 family protein [Shimia abyssi]PSL22143.1 uncharacterized protein DUF817 [Shimia abyssi]
MFASVGPYLARVIRLFEMRFAPFPPLWFAMALACAIYVNFFARHFVADMRALRFVATVALFWRTRIWFCIGVNWYWMPLPVAAFLFSIFLSLAKNVGTATRVWLYHGQGASDWVSLAKMGSWYLLLFVSFTTVTVVFREALMRDAWCPKSTRATSETQPTARPAQSG